MTWRALVDLADLGENCSFSSLPDIFYAAPSELMKQRWDKWLHDWISKRPDSEVMRKVNPIYVPREWMLVRAYEAAYRGDYSLVRELHELFERPYEARVGGLHEAYFRKAPEATLYKVIFFIIDFCFLIKVSILRLELLT